MEISLLSLSWILGLMAVAGVLTFAVTPYLRNVATRNGFIDWANHRKPHSAPTPVCGGLAIFVGLLPMFLGLIILSGLSEQFLGRSQFWKIFSLFCACVWILFLGILDDRIGLKWTQKLAGQAIGAVILAVGGYTMGAATLHFGDGALVGWLGAILFVLLLIAITNAINFIDGLDGLAPGICLLAGLAGGLAALVNGDPLVAILEFSVVGALIGFLPYNWPPARVFLGDGGSMVLGFFLASVALNSTGVSLPGRTSPVFSTLVAPLLPFTIPLLDLGLAIVRRWVRGRKIYLPDTDHLHHRLFREFKSPVRVNIVVYGFSAAMGGIAVLSVYNPDSASTFMFPGWVVALATGLVVIFLRTYRIESYRHVTRVFAERGDFKILDLYSEYLSARLARAESVSECVALLESGAGHLKFDALLIHRGQAVRKWQNPNPVHVGSPRMIMIEPIPSSDFLVKAIIPEHERTSYSNTLKECWDTIIGAFGARLRTLSIHPELVIDALPLDYSGDLQVSDRGLVAGGK